MAQEKIGKYLIQEKLGQGGMGIVYKCLDLEANRLVAVKVLPQQLASDAAFLQRFKREVTTLRRLDHQNIVKIYDQGTADGSYYYAMEFAEGTSLESILQNKEKMEPLRAIRIIRGCAEALEHSHAQGIIHRDIKPANIMLIPGGGIKLMDFGIAKVLDATRMTATMGVLGTVEYMSPEQSQGRPLDARSDLYSLGVLLYQCLTARLPISGTNPTEIIMKLRTQQIDAPDAWVPGLPKNLCTLIMRLLDKDPSKRVESARELLRELDRITQQIESGITGHGPAPVKERVLSTGVHSSAPVWRNPWVIALIILVALIAIWLKAAPSDDGIPPSPPQPPPPNQGNGGPVAGARSLLIVARRARNRKDYELAADVCELVIKHFVGTGYTDDAEHELLTIEQDKRRDAEEAAKREAEEAAQKEVEGEVTPAAESPDDPPVPE